MPLGDVVVQPVWSSLRHHYQHHSASNMHSTWEAPAGPEYFVVVPRRKQYRCLIAEEPVNSGPAIRYPKSESCPTMHEAVNTNKDQSANQDKTRNQNSDMPGGICCISRLQEGITITIEEHEQM